MNDDLVGNDEEDDFASYYNPEINGVDTNLQLQSLNHSRNMAGISVNRSLGSDTEKPG